MQIRDNLKIIFPTKFMQKQEISFVLFGGTGDLTKRKLVPAFARLIHEGRIRDDSTIIGISRKKMSDQEYKKFLIGSVKEDKDKEYIRKLDIRFFSGDFTKSGLSGLKQLIEKSEKPGCNRIYYLSTSFRFFPDIVKELKSQNLHKKDKVFTRMVFEKPFGDDLSSSEELDKEIHKVFSEEDVFRLDHYLAKETVMNLNVLKSTNTALYKTFSNKYIESIEIIIDEDLGVENRIEYYNDTGAIKDMFQSHLLQMLSLLLMELPHTLTADNIHDEKLKILKNLEILPASNHILGQYESYEKEAKASSLKLSKIETFAKIELNCKIPKWDGVKLILRTGKKLKNKIGKIKINFKTNSNNVIIDIYKKQEPNTPNEYATLLSEIIKGDKTLFTRSDEVAESWKIVEKIEKIRDKIKFIKYKDNSDPEE